MQDDSKSGVIFNFDQTLVDAIIRNYGPDLEEINFNNNGIKCIDNIVNFKSLKRLFLSSNQLVRIDPIGALTALVVLDLSFNQIYVMSSSTIASLANLFDLKYLDLSYNRLPSTESIRCLSNLPSLEELKLKGNPLCSRQMDYQAQIAAFLPPCVIDALPAQLFPPAVSASITSLPSTVPVPLLSAPAASVPSSSKDSNVRSMLTGGSYSAEEESFKLQISSLESALELQERIIASKASSAVNPKLPFEAKNCFPYLQMLQLWRNKTLSVLMKCAVSEKQLMQATQSFRRDRQILKQALSENEAKALKWEERYHSIVSKNESQANELHRIQEIWRQEHEQRQSAEAKLRTTELSLRQLDKILRHYKATFDELCIRSQVANVQCSNRIKVLEERLSAATSRVNLASELVYQKQIILRNNAAALKARESNLLQTIEQRKSDSESDKENINSSDKKFQDLTCRLEAQGLLRSLFQLLDPNDTGTISIVLFGECLCFDKLLTIAIAQIDRIDSNLVTAAADYDELFRVVKRVLSQSVAVKPAYIDTQYGESIWSALGSSLWNVLATNLLRLVIEKELLATETYKLKCDDSVIASIDNCMTWGELLLLLVPAGQSLGTSPTASYLTREEMQSLKKEQLWGDELFSAIPLQLPSEQPLAAGTKAAIAALSRTDVLSAQILATSSHDAKEEIARLSRERAFLLQRINELIKQLDRRVEGAKDFFQNSIRKGLNREQRLKSQLDAANADIASYALRLTESDRAMNELRERLESRIHSLELQNSRLSEELGSTRTEQLRKYEQTISDEHSRHDKLNSELAILQKEMGKKDTRLRGLQRDINQLQVTQTKALEEAAAQRKQIDGLQFEVSSKDKYIAELEEKLRVSQEWKSERDRLSEEIHSMRQLLTASSEQLLMQQQQQQSQQTVRATSTSPQVAAAVATAPPMPSSLPSTTSALGWVDAPKATLGSSVPAASSMLPAMRFPTASTVDSNGNSATSNTYLSSVLSLEIAQLARHAEELLKDI